LNIDQLKKQPATVVANVQSETSRSATAVEPPAAAPKPETDAGTELTESAIGLDRQGKVDLQERLLAIGYDLDADGDLGAKTRRAIGQWQEANGLPTTT
ncbi:peptidoglycan-binding domain-containing protein, partial [Mesorhizobium sp.]